MLSPVLKLADGNEMPALGYGTTLKGQACEEALRHALKVGYRHIDTALIYTNHEFVANGIEGHPRGELFITTKILSNRMRYDEVLADADRCLRELRVDYVDLLLVHWPSREVPMEETFGALGEVVDAGKARSIGVSNFTIRHLRKALEVSPRPITANQVEFHPHLFQENLLNYCKDQGIVVTAYRPLILGKVNEEETLRTIAKRHDATPVQVTLAWHLQHGLSAIPCSGNPEHIASNWRALALRLADREMRAIDALNRNKRYILPKGVADFDEG
jgi:diketogulonate reductase-like aldo/keto reductase